MMSLLRRRFVNQHLAGPLLERPEDVVRWLTAAQSQDYPGAKWSVGQRVRNGTDAAVERAFAAGRILRTHILRPTWHFVAPEDIRWMLQLTAPRVLVQNSYQYRELELDQAVFRRTAAVFERELRGGRHLTRAELGTRLGRAGIAAEGRRLAYIIMQAELTGLVCSGAPRGKQQTYALLEERAPGGRTLTREEALAELTRRFFQSHGPATLEHYAWWSGLTMADARAGVVMNQPDLSRIEADGRGFWLGTTPSPLRASLASAYLIPEYDEAILGYKDLAVPDLPRAPGARKWTDVWYRPVVIGGRRAGTWRRTVTLGKVALETNLLASLDGAQRRALAAAAERYGRFLGLPVKLA